MKVRLKKGLLLEEIDEMIDDYDDKKDGLTIEKVNYVLNNFDKFSKKDFYKMMCMFYDIELEDIDYLNYINKKTGEEFKKIIRIDTDVIHKNIESEGHGRDFSWWTVSSRLYLMVAVNCNIENNGKFFTIDEIKKLVQDNKIYPLDYYYEKCDDRLYENRVKNDIEYLIKYQVDRDNRQLLVDDEYFDFFIDDIIKFVDLNKIFISIRRFIVNYRCRLESYLEDYYFEDDNKKNEILDEINKVTEVYNEKIGLLNVDNNKINDDYIKNISIDPVELVIEYLSQLSSIDDFEWYQDIEIENIVRILENLDNENDKELCNKVNTLIINFADPELCLMVASNYLISKWIDYDKMIEIIINSKNEWVCYDTLNYLSDELDEIRIKKLLQVIIESENSEINYNVARLDFPFIDIKKHGDVVIKSGNVWYNYLFAIDVLGADVRAHGDVIIEYGDIDDNLMFINNIKGADIEKHQEVIRIKEENIYNSDCLKKVKTKK